MKKISIIAFISVLLFAFCACGKSNNDNLADSKYVGSWKVSTASLGDQTEEFSADWIITLNPDGTGDSVGQTEGETNSFTWSLTKDGFKTKGDMKLSFKDDGEGIKTKIIGLQLHFDKIVATEEDGQNPAMNFIGNYVCERASILIEADGMEGMKATVKWSGSASEHSEWHMSGAFYPDTMQFEYHDCVKTDVTVDEDGKVVSSEEVYTGGHGFMTFKEGNTLTLTWQEDQEHVADDMVFEFALSE